MNNKDLIEVKEAVDIINTDLYTQFTTTNKRGKEITDPWIWMGISCSPGEGLIVEFLGEYLYNSDTEERTWIDEEQFDDLTPNKAGYEPFEPFLRRKANELISKLSKVVL